MAKYSCFYSIEIYLSVTEESVSNDNCILLKLIKLINLLAF